MPETFSPEANGALLQRGYTIKPQYRVVEDPRELGNVKSIAVAQKGLRRLEGLLYKCRDRTPYEYITSFLNRHVGPAGRFLCTWPEFVPSPDATPVLTAVTGGTQGSRTMYVKYAWKTALGLTRPSTVQNLTVPANNLLKVTVPVFPPSVTQAVIYATQGTVGTEVEQAVIAALTWTQPDAALLTGTAAPATTNTARETPLCKLTEDGFSTQRLAGQTYEVTLDLEEAY
jgi:hypothetical protein